MCTHRVIHDQCIDRSRTCACLSAGTAQGYHCDVSLCGRVENNTGLRIFSLLAVSPCSRLGNSDCRKGRLCFENCKVVDDRVYEVLLYNSGDRSAHAYILSECKGDLDEYRTGVDLRIRVDRTVRQDCSFIRSILDILGIGQGIFHICIADYRTNNILRYDDRDESADAEPLRCCHAGQHHDDVLIKGSQDMSVLACIDR